MFPCFQSMLARVQPLLPNMNPVSVTWLYPIPDTADKPGPDNWFRAANHQRHSWRSGSKYDNPSFRSWEDERLTTWVWETRFAGVILKPKFVTKDRSLKRKRRQHKELKRQKPVGRRDCLWEKRWFPIFSNWHPFSWAPTCSGDWLCVSWDWLLNPHNKFPLS